MKTLREQLAEYEYQETDFINVGFREAYSILALLKDYPLSSPEALIRVYRPQPDGSLKPLEKKKKSWSEQLRERGAKEGDRYTYRTRRGEVEDSEVCDSDLSSGFDHLYESDVLLHLYRLDRETGELKEVGK